MKRTRYSVDELPDAINGSPNVNFTQISNELLRNPNISGKATKILCILLSNQDGWKSYIPFLLSMMKEGKDAVLSGLKELEELGYLKRIKYRDRITKKWRIIYIY